jgi:hypothetical protein
MEDRIGPLRRPVVERESDDGRADSVPMLDLHAATLLPAI